ncbi:transcriptional regulator [Bacterioplanoides sp.]|uniref:transcriptional regulator n=1 Tax=Bacterioplanoides sp. TaxID=2066072 RepID=UPI003AFF89AC
MSDPRCPKCDCEGIEHFASKPSTETAKNGTPWFYVVYCDQCGHVHDIISKHSFSANQSAFVMPNLRR